MFRDKKAVSRERLIGISFVDILIQAVFLLLVALMVGYRDPSDTEVVKGPFAGIGYDACMKLGKYNEAECRPVVENAVANFMKESEASLSLCIQPKVMNRPISSVSFVVLSPTRVRFKGFRSEYFQYLKGKGQSYSSRLKLAEKIEPGMVLELSEVIPVFGFLRESSCYHVISYRSWEGKWAESDLKGIFDELEKLRMMKPE
jgi:hypothetical protein